MMTLLAVEAVGPCRTTQLEGTGVRIRLPAPLLQTYHLEQPFWMSFQSMRLSQAVSINLIV